jgi:hypothetical protein
MKSLGSWLGTVIRNFMAFSFLSDIGLIAWNDNVSFTAVVQRNTKKAPRQFKKWNPDITKS